jgi:membrane protein insertase Oxa1/YidC/SpoIIIJ
VFFFWMFLSSKWSSAFVLYWLAQNVISIAQQYHFIYKPHRADQSGGGPKAPPGGNGKGAPVMDAAPIVEVKQPGGAKPRKKRK